MIRVLFALLLILPSATQTIAQDFEQVGSFMTLAGQEDLIFLAGDITTQTPLDFRTVLNRFPKAKTLVLASGGGSVTAGLLLADDVHLRGINTFVPADLGCYSACAFVFFAGKARQAEGDLGVHQFYGGEDTAERAQVVVSDIVDMLAKFDTPQPVVSRMLRTNSDDMYVFSEEEIENLGINRGDKALRMVGPEVAKVDGPIREAFAATLIEEPTVAAIPAEPEAPADNGLRFAVYSGVDFYGADVDKIRVSDLAQCLAACFENQQCKAITLNTNPAFKTGPNCFLKTSTGRGEFYEMAISGQLLLPGDNEYFAVNGKRVYPLEVLDGSD